MIDTISQQLRIPTDSVKNVIHLLEEDCTIPFIARYRKEKTGNLDEVKIQQIRDLHDRLTELEKRRTSILNSLAEQNVLTSELENQIRQAQSMVVLEDLYLPYKPKRKTRGSMAIEKGLQPLAIKLEKNQVLGIEELSRYINPDKDLKTIEEVLAGAQDIVAEKLNEQREIREPLRQMLQKKGILQIKKARNAPENHDFTAFIDKSELLSTLPSHRLLAILRGVQSGALSIHLHLEQIEAEKIYGQYLQKSLEQIIPSLRVAIQDSWKRLTQPSLENDVLNKAKEMADLKAIEIFAANLYSLLLAAPLGQKVMLAVDPGIRTGCKMVVLSAQGDLLDHTVIYPIEPFKKTVEAEKSVRKAIDHFRVEAIAIGNGTGGRETYDFFQSLNLTLPVLSVSESGASVYSASEVARDELPNYDVTVRGAVSIGRRLMDPLAELVKIDPKSIGVGQYQHDVDQKLLKQKLDDVVQVCVNKVGVDINTASKSILSHISGLNTKLAASILEYRQKNGPFRTRQDFMHVKGVGAKVFQQSAGFLRIRNAENPLDSSAVHPESYPLVEKISQKLHCSIKELVGRTNLAHEISEQDLKNWGAGRETLQDILHELQQPGLDPRPTMETQLFDQNIRKIEDLSEGLKLEGVVTNVTAFGAFVDIGVHQDGLVHISQLADRFVQDPFTVVQVGQKVRVKVITIDQEKKRIGLSMKDVN